MKFNAININAILVLALSAGGTVIGASMDDESGDQPGETIELTGVIRDFRTDHPDFEAYPGSGTKKMVKFKLDENGKPRFNTKLITKHGKSWGQEVQCTSVETFNQWFNDTPGVNISWPHSITLTKVGDKFVFAKERPEYFWPADGLGYGPSVGPLRWAQPGTHNFHFTYEVETDFTYTDPADRDYDLKFSFTGDDDVWVFINGRRAVDLGGVHSQQSASVNLDNRATKLGLVAGNTYKLKLFFAERHTSESNFRIETTLQLQTVELPPVSALYD